MLKRGFFILIVIVLVQSETFRMDFQMMDPDDDGVVTVKELASMYGSADNQYVLQYLSEFDLNSGIQYLNIDSTITFEEYAAKSKYNKTSEYIYFSYFIIISFIFNGYILNINIIYKTKRKRKTFVIFFLKYPINIRFLINQNIALKLQENISCLILYSQQDYLQFFIFY
ncbi:hypothetical protein pb186bvf_013695 [Paramecium bursaria]